MAKLIFDAKNALVDGGRLLALRNSIEPYAKKLQGIAAKRDWKADEASLLLPDDGEQLRLCQSMADAHAGASCVVVIGIGGSDQGARAAYSALGPRDVRRKLHFIDTVDDDNVMPAMDTLLKDDGAIVNCIAKSGSTTETIANLHLALGEIGRKRWKDRVVVTTGSGSKLDSFAKKAGIPTLPIPDKVGGRYSVFSSVGLFPLLMSGADCGRMLKGALEMRGECLEEDGPAALTASVAHLELQAGKTIHDDFYFSRDFEPMGKWYRQLNAESLGKQGKPAATPTVSIGSADLHSVFQLYAEGPRDKFFRINRVLRNNIALRLPKIEGLDMVENIAGKTLGDIMKSIVDGMEDDMRQRGMPFVETAVPDKGEAAIGAFMQHRMVEVMMMARLGGVNAFDQPGVEGYKAKARQRLAGGK